MKDKKGDWLGPQDVPLAGFSWRGGSERDTTGILMWSEIYLSELSTGEKVSEFLCLIYFVVIYFIGQKKLFVLKMSKTMYLRMLDTKSSVILISKSLSL